MKIFIFKPSKFWDYCGGMLIATANSFEKACERLQKNCEEDHLKTSGDLSSVENMKFLKEDLTHAGVCDCDTWVLFKEFECLNNTPDLCEIEYNYA